MKTELLVAVTAALSLGIIGTAEAVDAPAPAATAAPSETQTEAWSGFYAGFGFGLSEGSDSLDIFAGGGKGGPDFAGTVESQPQQIEGTVELGYDLQAGPVVFGAAANYDFGIADTESVDTLASRFDVRQRLGDGWGAGVRVGYLATPDLLLFGSLGYGGRQLTIDVVDGNEPGAPLSQSYDLAGLYLGAGLEMRLTDDLSVKAEYRHANYQQDLRSDTFGDNDDSYVTGSSVQVGQLRATLAWRF